MIELEVNGEIHQIDAELDTPLLWVVREHLGLTGTKFGCGVGVCGACTMHLNGAAIRTCVMPLAGVIGQKIRTIEDLGTYGPDGDAPHPLQDAWLAEQVPQCGYCQSGQLMMAAALLEKNRDPSDQEIADWMTNYCRCATYDRIREGVKRAAAAMPPLPEAEPAVEGPEGEVPSGDETGDAGDETTEDGAGDVGGAQ